MDEMTPQQLKEWLYDIITDKYLVSDTEEHRNDPHYIDIVRDNVVELLQDRRECRRWIDRILSQRYKHPDLGWMDANATWRDVPIKPHKFKRCVNCGRIFYDCSPNGRAITCRYIRYRKYNKKTYKWDRSYHADGRPKSACFMEWEARKERKRYNQTHHGIDDDRKLGIPETGRYKVKRVRKTVKGIPIDAPRNEEEAMILREYHFERRYKEEFYGNTFN